MAGSKLMCKGRGAAAGETPWRKQIKVITDRLSHIEPKTSGEGPGE